MTPKIPRTYDLLSRLLLREDFQRILSVRKAVEEQVLSCA